MKKKTQPAKIVNIRDAVPSPDLLRGLACLNYEDERLAAGLVLESTGKSPVTKTRHTDPVGRHSDFEGEIYAHTPDGRVYEVRSLGFEKGVVYDGFGLLQCPKGHFYPVSYRSDATGHFVSAVTYDTLGHVDRIDRTVQKTVAEMAHRRLMEWDRTTNGDLVKAHPRHYRGDWHDNSPRAIYARKAG